MVGWHHGLNGPEVEQTPGDSEGQESLTCWSPWGCKESATTEQLNNNNIQGSASLMLKTLLPSRGTVYLKVSGILFTWSPFPMHSWLWCSGGQPGALSRSLDLHTESSSLLHLIKFRNKFLDFSWFLVEGKRELGFPDGSVVKNPPANAGEVALIPGSGRSPGEGNGNSL